jgi:hypothetical protein
VSAQEKVTSVEVAVAEAQPPPEVIWTGNTGETKVRIVRVWGSPTAYRDSIHPTWRAKLVVEASTQIDALGAPSWRPVCFTRYTGKEGVLNDEIAAAGIGALATAVTALAADLASRDRTIACMQVQLTGHCS